MTRSLKDIGAVNPRRGHLDEKIGRPGGWIRDLCEAQGVRLARLIDEYGLHDLDRIVRDELPQDGVNSAYPRG